MIFYDVISPAQKFVFMATKNKVLPPLPYEPLLNIGISFMFLESYLVVLRELFQFGSQGHS